MCWYNFFLQYSDYKSRVYKNWGHPVCHKNILIAINLIIHRNSFISHPSAGLFLSRNETKSLPKKNALDISYWQKYDQKSRGGREEQATPQFWKLQCRWHIEIKQLTPETQRKYILNLNPTIPWGSDDWFSKSTKFYWIFFNS